MGSKSGRRKSPRSFLKVAVFLLAIVGVFFLFREAILYLRPNTEDRYSVLRSDYKELSEQFELCKKALADCKLGVIKPGPGPGLGLGY
jgi:hypothetical protein